MSFKLYKIPRGQQQAKEDLNLANKGFSFADSSNTNNYYRQTPKSKQGEAALVSRRSRASELNKVDSLVLSRRRQAVHIQGLTSSP